MINYLIEKILGYKTYSIRRKIDSLLEMDAEIYCNLGSESTKTERLEAKKQSKAIYRAIKKLDKEVLQTSCLFICPTNRVKYKTHRVYKCFLKHNIIVNIFL